MNLYEYTNTTELYTEMGEFYVTELYGYMGLYGYQKTNKQTKRSNEGTFLSW